MTETFGLREAPLPRFQRMAAQARSRGNELYMVFVRGGVGALPVDSEEGTAEEVEAQARSCPGWALVEVPDPHGDGWDPATGRTVPGRVADAAEAAAREGRDPADEVARETGGRVVHRHDAPAGN